MMVEIGQTILQVMLFASFAFYGIALLVLSFLAYAENPQLAFRQRVLSFICFVASGAILIV